MIKIVSVFGVFKKEKLTTEKSVTGVAQGKAAIQELIRDAWREGQCQLADTLDPGQRGIETATVARDTLRGATRGGRQSRVLSVRIRSGRSDPHSTTSLTCWPSNEVPFLSTEQFEKGSLST